MFRYPGSERADGAGPQQGVAQGHIDPILGSEFMHDNKLRIRRTGAHGEILLVRLPECQNDDSNKFNPPFKSVHWVMFGDMALRSSVGPVKPGEIFMLPVQENKDVMLRAYGYLLSKKNRMYLDFRIKCTNGKLDSNEPARFESEYEDGKFAGEAALATLKPRGQRLQMQSMRTFNPSDISGVLLLASYHPDSHVLQLYHPESECLYTEKLTENDIVLWESEEALEALYRWVTFINIHLGHERVVSYRPESEKTKREVNFLYPGPNPKRGRSEVEAEEEDQEMEDA